MCQGDARVDVAVVNGSLSGYEIKSDRDTLARLPRQLAVYELCFDFMTIVVGPRHLDECRETVPQWWGIWEAISTDEGIKFERRQETSVNHRSTPERVVQLLWRGEALDALRELGVKASLKSTRQELWAVLVGSVPPQKLFQIVRKRIRARGDWRSAPTPFRCGGLSRCAASVQRCQENRQWLLSAGSQRHPH